VSSVSPAPLPGATHIQNKAIERWNGTLPQFTGGGAIPFLDLKDLSAAR